MPEDRPVVPVLSAADVVREVASGAVAVGEDGPLAGPVILVDVGGDGGGAPEPAEVVAAAARRLAAAPLVSVGVSHGPVAPWLEPLLPALTCTVASGGGTVASGGGMVAGERRDVVAVPDGRPARLAAAELAAAAVARPLAAVALDGLLRTTARLPVFEGLVAESAVYSTLLAGPEFAGWLATAARPAPPPDDDRPVLVEQDGDVLRVVLNRPARRNAYGRAVRDGLVEALAVALAVPELRVELSGAGNAFCSGGDLAEFGSTPDPATAHLIRLRRSVGWLLSELAGRTRVVVHGACVGAGVELPSFTARVLARPDAFFALPEVAMGLVPGAGGTVSLTARIGRHRTAWLALSGERLPAETALRWGLVDAVLSG